MKSSAAGQSRALCFCLVVAFSVAGSMIRAQDIGAPLDGGQYQAKTIPAGKEAPTWDQFAKRRAGWLEKFTLERYAKNGKHDPAWDTEAQEFIRKAIHLRDEPTPIPVPNELKATGDKIHAAGCRDPFFLYWRGILQVRSMGPGDASKLIADADLAKASQLYANLQIAEYKNPQSDSPEVNQSAMRALAAALNGGEIDDHATEFVPSWLSKIAEYTAGDWELLLVESRKGSKPLDPWLDAYLEGNLEIRRAWEARGHGYADTVSPKGWSGFDEHLTRARELLIKCHRLHPDRPEPAKQMIGVAMGKPASANETRYWFDQAVAARMDHLPAYDAYLWSLRPRWGGSHMEMLKFGEEAAATRRFDTFVPMMFIDAVGETGSELPGGMYRAAFRTRDIPQKITRILDAYSTSSLAMEYGDFWKNQQALIECAMGHYSEAFNIFERVSKRPLFLRPLLSEPGYIGGRSWLIAKTESEMFTGKFSRQMKEAGNQELNGNSDEAIKLYKAVMDVQIDEINRSYVRDRMAIVMMSPHSENHTLREGYPLLRFAEAMGAADAAKFLMASGGDKKSSRKPRKNLMEAVIAGDVKLVTEMLDLGMPADSDPRQDWTPLFMAINQKQNQIAILLIDNGADLEAQLSDGTTLLMAAATSGNIEVARKLIASKADVNAANDAGTNPLFHAVDQSNLEFVNLLLEAGANPNLASAQGWLPLHLSLRNKHKEITQALLDHGADPNRQGKQNPPVSYALMDRSEVSGLVMQAAQKDAPARKAPSSTNVQRRPVRNRPAIDMSGAPVETPTSEPGAPVTPP